MGSAPAGQGPTSADGDAAGGAAASVAAEEDAEEDEKEDDDEGEWAPVCSRSSRIRKQKKVSRKAAAEARRAEEVRHAPLLCAPEELLRPSAWVATLLRGCRDKAALSEETLVHVNEIATVLLCFEGRGGGSKGGGGGSEGR
jgi:hypothetical protein